ncbi:MAG: two-component system, cell cycle sensor histidine kinase and response regulator CckA [Acidobacteriota bacterium]|jgi:PAS domain S-box-containing protein|nr:two-component system, cell cycle sensor histidine kinase and response regulator CckA [Acidobacteriota bacterium]
MTKRQTDLPSGRLQSQLKSLQAQVAEPNAVSRKQLLEAIGALQESLQELDVAEAELAQQNEELLVAREALEVERHRYRELFDEAPFAYLVTDANGVVQEANLAAAVLFNTARTILQGKPLPLLIAQDDRPRFRELLRELRMRPGRREAEVRLGSVARMVTLTAEPDETPGRPLFLRWVLRDVTDRRAAEEELRVSQERLRHAQRLEAVGRLAGGIAHSFNNLLAAIAFHAELLLGSRSEKDQRRHAEEIQNAGERGALLARQLLAFSRKQVLQPQLLDVSSRIESLVPILRRLVGEQIELRTDLDSGPGWVHADLGQVEQVILNLVANARDAMPDGGLLSVSVGSEELADGDPRLVGIGLQPGRYVCIRVADTGTGMSEHVRAHLFEPFFTTKDYDRGTGLGLATIYGTVSQSGGAIHVETELGKGSTFTVYFPQAKEPKEAVPRSEPAREMARGTEVILLTEDEDNIREPAQEILEARGYTVLAACDGAHAIEAARAWDGPIHLLISDVVMPGMSGSELAAQLEAERPGLRVLYISGYPEDAIARHGVLQRGRSFLQKPFPPGVLMQTVRDILDQGDQWPAVTSS